MYGGNLCTIWELMYELMYSCDFPNYAIFNDKCCAAFNGVAHGILVLAHYVRDSSKTVIIRVV